MSGLTRRLILHRWPLVEHQRQIRVNSEHLDIFDYLSPILFGEEGEEKENHLDDVWMIVIDAFVCVADAVSPRAEVVANKQKTLLLRLQYLRERRQTRKTVKKSLSAAQWTLNRTPVDCAVRKANTKKSLERRLSRRHMHRPVGVRPLAVRVLVVYH